MRKIKNPWMDKEGYNCFGCSPDNPIGVHMEFFRRRRRHNKLLETADPLSGMDRHHARRHIVHTY